MIECCVINYCINVFYLYVIFLYLILLVIMVFFKENIESFIKIVNFMMIN